MKNFIIGILGFGLIVSVTLNLILNNKEQDREVGFTHYVSFLHNQVSYTESAAQFHLREQTEDSYQQLFVRKCTF
ncbi:uncharacterized protein YxeA [Geomicrobium sediminis]|uniref:Uncharacterized protein YxeA n=1 Tax=Geomicrobium sediminis TaxID=1347788 RepID=A0ABS2PFN2_9BACL|nr:uncharacterized protein YxeA [Geomicrobium sediminis]